MSVQLIQKYYAEVEKLIRYGGSRNESSLRRAFINLLESYASSKNLVLVPELELVTGAGRRIIPDGTSKDALLQDWSHWESKDEADDIEEETKKKFARGYPRDNILGSGKPHIFISYAHKDTPFVKDIVEGLENRNVNVWVDWSGIPPTAEWWQEILKAIDGCSAFIFFISNHSVKSEVCQREIEHADSTGKRFIPVLLTNVEASKIPSQISAYQWIDLAELEDQKSIVSKLIEAIELDLAWNEKHASLLIRMREWKENNSESSRLLRGKELEEAERWMDGADPESGRIVSVEQKAFIETSRRKFASRVLPIFYSALLLFIVFIFIENFINRPLQTTAAPYGIVSFENAGSIAAIEEIRASWRSVFGAQTYIYAALSLGLDFLFVFSYSGSLISICLYFARALKRRLNPIARMSVVVIVLVIMAGFLDIIENVMLISLLLGSNNIILPRIASGSAALKFLFLSISILFIILAAIISFWVRKKRAK